MVYIREAHALDSASPLGGDGHPILEDPESLAERGEVARMCMTKLALEPMPSLVDDMEDTANRAYRAAPDRLYLIGKDGRVAMQGGPGPFGFNPDDLEDAIREELGLDD